MATPALSLFLLAAACSPPAPHSPEAATAGIDSLNARLVEAYRDHDARAYGALFTDSALFEWPAFPSVRGPAELEEMALANWATLQDMDLRLIVSTRRVAADHATELGAFEQSWNDSSGVRMTEYGRYAAVLARDEPGVWRMDRFMGFADSTVRQPAGR